MTGACVGGSSGYAGHVGQIVLLARQLAGGRWSMMSILRRKPQ